MAGITKKEAQRHLDIWLEAEAQIATGQSYQIGSRMLTRADLASVRKQIDYWNNKVMQAEAVEENHGRNRTYHFVYRDMQQAPAGGRDAGRRNDMDAGAGPRRQDGAAERFAHYAAGTSRAGARRAGAGPGAGKPETVGAVQRRRAERSGYHGGLHDLYRKRSSRRSAAAGRDDPGGSVDRCSRPDEH